MLKISTKIYTAQPVRRVWISKDGKRVKPDRSNGRPLGIPTIFDRAYQALWALALEPIAEETGDRFSYGFRPYRGAHDALTKAFLRFSNRKRPLWVLEGDIEKCYDRISHQWILENIPMDKTALSQFLKAGILEEGKKHESEMGVPQGGVISPIIANMTLDGLEKAIELAVSPINDFTRNDLNRYPVKVTCIRYADDFIVSGARRELLEQTVKPAIAKFLEPRGLRMSEKKTVISNLWDGFNFLGFNARLYKTNSREDGATLLIKPSKKSVAKVKDSLRQIVGDPKIQTEAHLIEKMNPVLRGWGNYFRTVVSKKTFSHVAHYTWTLTWIWLQRKYPKTSRRALAKRGYMSNKTRKWIFYGKREEGIFQLFDIQSIPIARRKWLDTSKNIFDPEHKEYFALWRRHCSYSSGWDKTTERLVKTQCGICPVCEGTLMRTQSIEKHHRLAKAHGGTDKNQNLVVLHTECHKQVTHSNNKRLLETFIKKGVIIPATGPEEKAKPSLPEAKPKTEGTE
jgi:RNA-directed DNA polymerase